MSEIGYEKQTDKEVPETFVDAEHEKMKGNAIRKLEQSQADQEVRAEAGITEIPKAPESIPKELPKIIFQVGAKMIRCEKFELTPDEAKDMAKHLSIVIGPVSSKVYSVCIIVIIVVSKVTDCFGKIKDKFTRNKDRDEDPQYMD